MTKEISTQENQALPSDASASVVVLVHGIRTHGQWMTAVRSSLENAGFTVSTTNYGRFDAFRFWLPIPWIRRRAVRHVWTDIRRAVQMHPGKKISFIAHSYGTHIITEILKSEFDFTADRLIFCGSIVQRRFPFEQISNRFQSPILNEIGTKDIWPLLAKCSTWGYDSSGTYGFMRPDVKDRQHENFAHSDFLNSEFCSTYWIPFLLDGEVLETNHTEIRPSRWLRLCSLFPVKYLAVGTILLALWFSIGPQLLSVAPTITAKNRSAIQTALNGNSGHRIDRQFKTNLWRAGMGYNACFQEFAVAKQITPNVLGLIAQTQPHLDQLDVEVFNSG